MKPFSLLLIAIFSLYNGIAEAQIAKQKVAVYTTGEINESYKKVIGSKLVSGITRSDNYAAVERTSDFLSALSKEHDYQMSGAVSDDQIARLGQQFGVQYVLVADISEIFGSMFISARMIDVQTGQITASAEANQVVNSLSGLTELSDNIIRTLLYYTVNTHDNAIKIEGPFHTANEISQYTPPFGYHIATKEEIEKIITNNRLQNKKTTFPIYADIISSKEGISDSITILLDKKNQVTFPYTYYKISVNFTYFENSNFRHEVSGYIDDRHFIRIMNELIRAHGQYCRYIGHTTNKSTTTNICTGYIYVVKDGTFNY